MLELLNHDLLEDCPDVTMAQLRAQGYPEQLITSMKAITKVEGESRSEYLTRCMKDKPAHLVKIADTMCNLEQSVISFDKMRVGKYSKQLKKLIDGWGIHYDTYRFIEELKNYKENQIKKAKKFEATMKKFKEMDLL